jgi:hypothetical protein
MNRKMYILFFVIPTLRGLIAFFRYKDLNNTGLDDIIANQIESLVANLETWVNEP